MSVDSDSLRIDQNIDSFGLVGPVIATNCYFPPFDATCTRSFR
jgi:hypothetical protein